MWCSHVMFTCDVHMCCSHVTFIGAACDLPYVMFVCDVHMWFCNVHMWFDVKSHTCTQITYEITCEHFGCLHVMFTCEHKIFTCDLARLSHACPHVITCGNHMWFSCTHVMFTCEHTRMWVHMWTLFPLRCCVLCTTAIIVAVAFGFASQLGRLGGGKQKKGGGD